MSKKKHKAKLITLCKCERYMENSRVPHVWIIPCVGAAGVFERRFYFDDETEEDGFGNEIMIYRERDDEE